MNNGVKKSQFGTALFIVAMIVGYLVGSGAFEFDGSQTSTNEHSFGIVFWMAASGLAFVFSFGVHLLLKKKKSSMEESGEISGDERMFEPFYGSSIPERLGVIASVALLGSLPVLSVYLVFSDLQHPWVNIFTGAAGILALMIISIYIVILFRKSREFYDRYELILIPTIMYFFSMVVYKYGLSLQNIPFPDGISEGDLLVVIYSVVAIPVGVKLILSANRTIFDKKARAEDELQFASEVQQQFLQDRSIETENTEGFGTSVAARQVGGDFLYLDTLEDQSLVAAIGDVSGHSFGAGLIMSMLVTMTEDYLQFRKSPGGLMEALNRKLFDQPKRNIFATMGCIRLDGDRATIWNAGHMPVLKYSSSDGNLTKIKSPGFALGMTNKANYSSTDVPISQGDILVLYSDGLVETRNEDGEIRGEDDFHKIVQSVLEKEDSCKEIANSVMEAVLNDDYSEYPEDDLTIVVLKRGSFSPADELS